MNSDWLQLSKPHCRWHKHLLCLRFSNSLASATSGKCEHQVPTLGITARTKAVFVATIRFVVPVAPTIKATGWRSWCGSNRRWLKGLSTIRLDNTGQLPDEPLEAEVRHEQTRPCTPQGPHGPRPLAQCVIQLLAVGLREAQHVALHCAAVLDATLAPARVGTALGKHPVVAEENPARCEGLPSQVKLEQHLTLLMSGVEVDNLGGWHDAAPREGSRKAQRHH
mmetsp:Transcript_32119/g.88574  ORF Transcript_32119/g.88574 Transcript_32119/m.88574 type:complete len:223 (+) Transcript_32119:128-796(+)